MDVLVHKAGIEPSGDREAVERFKSVFVSRSNSKWINVVVLKADNIGIEPVKRLVDQDCESTLCVVYGCLVIALTKAPNRVDVAIRRLLLFVQHAPAPTIVAGVCVDRRAIGRSVRVPK